MAAKLAVEVGKEEEEEGRCAGVERGRGEREVLCFLETERE